MYLGGGAFGDAQGHAMSDDDGDGVYEVTHLKLVQIKLELIIFS